MTPATQPVRSPGAGSGTSIALVAAVGLTGLFDNLPFPLGGVLGVIGALVAIVLRRHPPFRDRLWVALPVLLTISVESIFAPAGAGPELLAGLSALALLAWWADDGVRPVGGAARAVVALTMVAVGIGAAWAIVLLWPHRTSDVGAAGALIAVGLVALAILLARIRRGPTPRPSGG